MTNDDIMTVEEVAKFLKMKPQTVYKWAQEGRIPGTKLSKEWRFRRRILDEWLNTRITLSKGGFELMYQQSLVTVRQQGLTETSVDKLLQELECGEDG